VMSRLVLIASAILLVAAPADLNPATMKAFERYVQLTETRIATEMSGAVPFLWIDRQPEPRRSSLLADLKEGEVVSERLKTRDGTATISVPDGLIHHWIGTVIIPNTKLDRVVGFVQDYGKYPDVFGPLIQQARILTSTPTDFVVMMRTSSTKATVTVVIDADYHVEYRHFGATKLYTRSVAENIYHVKNAGTPKQQRIPAPQSDGFLWGLNTYCSFEERAEGVYEQCESISLTRNAPLIIRPLVMPFVTSIPRETLAFTLGKVRAGVTK
jgi:hypothetical protein